MGTRLNFIKRCREYDKNGKEFDITYVFNNILKNNRYISDGDEKTIVIPKKSENYVNDNNLYKVTY